jgi:hypothetical protein
MDAVPAAGHIRHIWQEVAMSNAEANACLVEAVDLARLKALRHRCEVAATEAAAIAAEAEQLGRQLRSRAQWLILEEEHRRRRREVPRPGG